MKNRISQNTVEGHGTMTGKEIPISAKLKKHFIDEGHWDTMPGEYKYVYALLGSVQEQMEHEAGEHVTYSAALDMLTGGEFRMPEDMKKQLASILPD